MKEWDRAYEAFPNYAAAFVWKNVAAAIEDYPGERIYEVGFGSGSNLLWAYQKGWEVAGCEVAYAAYASGRATLRDADLRKESIVDCTAPSGYYDLVIDRAAMTYLSPKDLKAGLFHVRRILRPGGVFLFNPYGVKHTKPFPEHMPPATKWEVKDARRLFPDTKWELLEFQNMSISYPNDAGAVENTLQYVVRKIGA